jgi:hypothetical protein
MSDMMTWIVVATAVVAGSASIASAQDFDPSGANRGYPQYAAPGSTQYYGGQLQGSRAESVTVAPLKSVQAGLHRNVTAVRRHSPRRAVAPVPGDVTPLE